MDKYEISGRPRVTPEEIWMYREMVKVIESPEVISYESLRGSNVTTDDVERSF